MVNVNHILAQKPAALYSVAPGDSVHHVLEMMRESRVRSVVVLEQGHLLGIVAERDCALKVLLPGLDPNHTAARDIMTKDVVTVDPEDSLDHCMLQMTSRNIRHLPVRRGRAVIGMVSVGDVVKEVMRQQAEHIRYLETYIRGHGAS